jgi:hypothetical protein
LLRRTADRTAPTQRTWKELPPSFRSRRRLWNPDPFEVRRYQPYVYMHTKPTNRFSPLWLIPSWKLLHHKVQGSKTAPDLRHFPRAAVRSSSPPITSHYRGPTTSRATQTSIPRPFSSVSNRLSDLTELRQRYSWWAVLSDDYVLCNKTTTPKYKTFKQIKISMEDWAAERQESSFPCRRLSSECVPSLFALCYFWSTAKLSCLYIYAWGEKEKQIN